jgi:hypothetical protein
LTGNAGYVKTDRCCSISAWKSHAKGCRKGRASLVLVYAVKIQEFMWNLKWMIILVTIGATRLIREIWKPYQENIH